MERVLAALPHEVIGELAVMLADAITRSNAGKGMLHVYDKQKDILVLVTSRSLTVDFLRHFRTVKPFDSSSSGRAAGTGGVILIPDVTKEPGYEPHLKFALDDGIKATGAIPLYQGSRLVGVLTVHFTERQNKASRIDPLNLPTAQIASLLYEIIKQKEGYN